MDNLEKLIQIVSDENIILFYDDKLPYNLEGLYADIKDVGPAIFLQKDIKQNKDKHIEILSEELGHHFTSAGDTISDANNYLKRILINKSERKASNWGVNKLITNSDLERAFKNNCSSYYDVAEFLDVPEKLVVEKFRYLAAKNVNGYVELGEYKIVLTNLPNIMIYKEI